MKTNLKTCSILVVVVSLWNSPTFADSKTELLSSQLSVCAEIAVLGRDMVEWRQEKPDYAAFFADFRSRAESGSGVADQTAVFLTRIVENQMPIHSPDNLEKWKVDV